MTRAVQIAELGDQNVFSIDGDNDRVGIGSTQPTVALDVDGVVVATAFTGDGTGLTGVAGGKFSANATGINTTTSVGIGTTNATGAADSNNTAVLNVGVVTANNFYGALTGNVTGTASLASNLTGTPDITVRNVTGVAATFTGVLTYDDVTNVDSIGIVTARSGVKVVGGGVSVTAGGINVTAGGLTVVGGAITFAAGPILNNGSFIRGINNSGDPKIIGGYISGSNDLRLGEVLYLTSAGNLGISSSSPSTKLDVAGTVKATSYQGDGSALTGIAVGLNTAAAAVAGIVTTLDLSSAQDHKLTVSGISTITVKGGTEGDSHTVRIINSGITTVGFSTFFLFPSGADPSMPTVSGAISLISFTVNRVGAGGTQLLAGAALNYS